MRSGYSDDVDNWDLIRWRGRVASAMRGSRGQKLLCELLAALDEMPVKRLIKNELATPQGEVCLLGAGAKRLGIEGIDKIDPEDFDHHGELAEKFNVAECLIREIEYVNDEMGMYQETPEQRYQRVRNWLVKKIATDAVPSSWVSASPAAKEGA